MIKNLATPPKEHSDYDVYFELVKQAMIHLDNRMDDFDKRMDSACVKMDGLIAKLQTTELQLQRIEMESVAIKEIPPMCSRLKDVENVQLNCPGRKILSWSTIVGMLTILSLCAGILFQWKEMRDMEKNRESAVENSVNKYLHTRSTNPPSIDKTIK